MGTYSNNTQAVKLFLHGYFWIMLIRFFGFWYHLKILKSSISRNVVFVILVTNNDNFSYANENPLSITLLWEILLTILVSCILGQGCIKKMVSGAAAMVKLPLENGPIRYTLPLRIASLWSWLLLDTDFSQPWLGVVTRVRKDGV